MTANENGSMPKDERRARRIGAALIALGLVLNPWAVASIATSDGTIDAPVVRACIWLFDLTALVSGLSLLRRRRIPKARTLALGLALASLGILTSEAGLHVLDWARHRGDEHLEPRIMLSPYPRVLLSPYEGADWARELYEELGPERGVENNFVFHPQLGWAQKPYKGKYVQVNEHGIRRTWNPPDLPDNAPMLYLFGGSTVWGLGARDDYTLPSQLSRTLAQRGHPFEVHNYGQLAYTFPQDQDLIQLILLLKEGHRPTYVVFYNGVNDLYGAYWNGEPGGTLPWKAQSSRLDTPAIHLKIAVRQLLERYSLLYTGLQALLAPRLSSPEAGAHMTDGDLQALARSVIDDYQSSRELLEKLAAGYGFEYLTFWQPVTFTEQALREEERTDPRTGDEALGKLHRFALEELRRRDLDRFHDLSGALRDRTHTYYLDYRHLSEDGNGAVAKRIADFLLGTFDDPQEDDPHAEHPPTDAAQRGSLR